jgi:hypothetical protein
MILQLHGYTIKQREGAHVIVGTDKDDAHVELLQYVNLWWDDVSTAAELDEPPDDDEEAIGMYFDLHREETAYYFTGEINIPPSPGFTTILEALEDVLSYGPNGLECNCGDGCEGTCTRAKVLNAIALAKGETP